MQDDGLAVDVAVAVASSSLLPAAAARQRRRGLLRFNPLFCPGSFSLPSHSERLIALPLSDSDSLSLDDVDISLELVLE